MKSYDDAAEFHRFFEEHHRELARFACLLVDDADAAADLTADAFVATWRRWERAAEDPLAHVRRMVAGLAERRGGPPDRPDPEAGTADAAGAWTVGDEGEPGDAEGGPGVTPIRVALAALRPRDRACVVLRHAFALSEDETAAALGISARAVRRRAARGVRSIGTTLSLPRAPRARGRRSAAGQANPAVDRLRVALHREVDACEPDRARMRARVAAALRARVARRAAYRVTGAVIAIVALVMVAVTAMSYLTRPDTSAASDGSSMITPRRTAPGARLRPTAGPPLRPAVSLRPGPPVMHVTPRIDTGSNPYWGQNDVKLTTDRPLTGLRVTVRVARTGGTRATGSWTSLSAADFTVTSRKDGQHLVYQWTLKPGRTVPQGTFTFAAQYGHAHGRRDSRQDGFSVTASGDTGKPRKAHGHF